MELTNMRKKESNHSDGVSLTTEQKNWIRKRNSVIYYEEVEKYCKKYLPWNRGRMTYRGIVNEVHVQRNKRLQKEINILKKNIKEQYLVINAEGEFFRAEDLNEMTERGVKNIFEKKFNVAFDKSKGCLKNKMPEIEERENYLAAIHCLFRRTMASMSATEGKIQKKGIDGVVKYTKAIYIQKVDIYAKTIADLIKLSFPETNFNIEINYDSLKISKYNYHDSEMDRYDNMYTYLKEMTKKKFVRSEIGGKYKDIYYDKLELE